MMGNNGINLYNPLKNKDIFYYDILKIVLERD